MTAAVAATYAAEALGCFALVVGFVWWVASSSKPRGDDR